MSTREEIMLPELDPPISHFCHAVRFGDLLFIMGCGPTDSDQNLVGGDDVAAQTRQLLTNMGKILNSVGLGFGDILKVTVFLTDVDDRKKINPVRKEFFGSARPASTLVEVSKLAVPGMKVEIEAIAGFPSR